jgi:hypothetical protein
MNVKIVGHEAKEGGCWAEVAALPAALAKASHG